MRPIQVVLVLALVAGAVLFVGRLRSRLLDRMLLILMALTGIVLVLFPNLTKIVAEAVGVGRGVDLVIYLSLVGLGYLWLVLFTRQRRLEERLTALARSVAMAQARVPVEQRRQEEGAADETAR